MTAGYEPARCRFLRSMVVGLTRRVSLPILQLARREHEWPAEPHAPPSMCCSLVVVSPSPKILLKAGASPLAEGDGGILPLEGAHRQYR